MNTIRFITFTDIHISDTNPTSRLGNYREDILNKLRQIGKVGKKLGVDFYIMAGDLYHLKSPSRNSHELNRLLIETFKDYKSPIYTTEGNHDLKQDSYSTFGEQPLSVLYADNTLIKARKKSIKFGNNKILIDSIPFSEEPELEDKNKEKDDFDLKIKILHLYATKKGGNLFGHKLFSYDEISNLNDDIFVLGHYHIDQGIEIIDKKDKKQYFINVGAISRGSLSEDDINREPKICYVQVNLEENKRPIIKAQPVKLKVKPASEVFDLEEKKIEKEKMEDAEKFVGKLQEEIKDIGTNVDIIDEEIEKSNFEKSIIDKVKYFLNEADLKIKEIK